MKPISVLNLLATFAVVFTVSLIALDLCIRTGGNPLVFSSVLGFGVLAGSGVLAILARAVRQLKKRKRTWLSYHKAPYVLVAAQACMVWSTIFLGYLASELVMMWFLRHTPLTSQLGSVAWLMFTNLGLLAMGYYTQWVCTIDDEPDAPGKGETNGTQTPVGC